MSLDAALGELNTRLRAGHHCCTVERRKATLVLRATLVDRSDPSVRRRQRVALGLPADYASLPEAERHAIELSHQLRAGTFDWSTWVHPEASSAPSVADFRAAAQRLHATKYAKTPERGANAWSKKWAPALNKMPPSGAVTEATLLRVIQAMPAGSAGRRDQGNLLAQVAREVGIATEALHEAARGYGAASLTPRDIPSDADIEAAWEQLKQPHWRWTWGMCAAYGLRPHEVVGIEWLHDDWIRVAEATKTGTRQVTACPSAWVERFTLRDLPRPTQDPHSLAKVFGDALERTRIAIKPYSLRHAYALRLMDHGVPPELGARLMGHSLVTHEATYKRWLSADRITRAMGRFNL